jgi:hypothetical protein
MQPQSSVVCACRDLDVCGRPYYPWLDTATCCLGEFFRHQSNNNNICEECYLSLPERDNKFYDRVIRHHLHIETRENYLQCHSCNTILQFHGAPEACSWCYDALFNVVHRWRETDDTPHLRDETITILLRESFECLNVEE